MDIGSYNKGIKEGDIVMPRNPIGSVWKLGEVVETHGVINQQCMVQELLDGGKGELYPSTLHNLLRVSDKIFEIEEFLRGLPSLIIFQREHGDIAVQNIKIGTVSMFLDNGGLGQEDIEKAVKIPC